MILTVRRFNGGYSFLEGGKIKDGFPLLEGRAIFVDDILVNVAHHKDEKRKGNGFHFRFRYDEPGVGNQDSVWAEVLALRGLT